jgi:hypothetical protein
MENAIEQARFEVARAFRQYDAVDPANRLVAADLERRWNDRLTVLRSLEEDFTRLNAAPAPRLNASDRGRLITLGSDLSLAWDRPDVTIETRKKIIRMLISEIIVDITDDTITTIIHWHGGDHTRLEAVSKRHHN